MEWSLSAGGGRLFLASDWVLAPNSCCWLKAALVCIEIWKFLLFWVNALIGSCESLGRLRQRTNYYIMPICSLNSFFFFFLFFGGSFSALNECTEWCQKKEGKKRVQCAEWSSCGLACVSGSFKPSWLGSQTMARIWSSPGKSEPTGLPLSNNLSRDTQRLAQECSF